MSSRTLAILSDLHCGSEIGLCPPNLLMVDGSTRGLNPYQEWLWRCWEEAVELIPSGSSLILNGDLLESPHHGTKEIISSRVEDHLAACLFSLEPLLTKISSTRIGEGTECHVGDLEHAIGKQIGAIANPETGRYVWPQINIEFCGTPILAQHHMPTTSKAHLEANALGMEMANIVYNRARCGFTVPKVVLLAHRHCGGYYSSGHNLCVVNGAWQGLTRWGRNKVAAALPTPTLTILDWNGIPDGDLPVVRYHIFKPKAPHIEQVS
jgi:hypothetical protein